MTAVSQAESIPEGLQLRTGAFNSPPPQIEMIQRDDDEGVADFFVGDQFWNFRHRHEPRRQILAVEARDSVAGLLKKARGLQQHLNLVASVASYYIMRDGWN